MPADGMNVSKRLKLGGIGAHHIVNWTRRRATSKFGRMVGRRLPLARTPHVVEIELTNDCNQSCVHCPRSRMTRPVGYMTFETFRRVVDEMSTYSYTVLRMVGLGEAAMHPEFGRMLRYAKDKKVDIDLTSNGTVFEVLTYDEIVDSSIAVLGISIDGVDERSYSRIRIGGKYHELRAHMEQFMRYKQQVGRGPMVQIRSVIMAHQSNNSASYVEKFKQEWQGRYDRVKFNTMMPTNKELVYESSQICDDIFFNAHVRWDGRVPLCNFQIHYGQAEWLGNVSETPLAILWKGERPQEVRRAHLDGDMAKAEFCKRCFYQMCQKKTKENQGRFNVNRSAFVGILERMAWKILQ